MIKPSSRALFPQYISGGDLEPLIEGGGDCVLNLLDKGDGDLLEDTLDLEGDGDLLEDTLDLEGDGDLLEDTLDLEGDGDLKNE